MKEPKGLPGIVGAPQGAKGWPAGPGEDTNGTVSVTTLGVLEMMLSDSGEPGKDVGETVMVVVQGGSESVTGVVSGAKV